jgi:hypothetical protein
MAPFERQALENVLVERRLLDVGNPQGNDRRTSAASKNDRPG